MQYLDTIQMINKYVIKLESLMYSKSCNRYKKCMEQKGIANTLPK